MAEPHRFESHQPLNAVRHPALSPGLEPVAQDEPTQLSGLPKRMTPLAAGSHASSTHFRLEATGHHTAALAQGVAGAPQIISANAIERSVEAVACESMNLLHKVRILVVNGDARQFTDHRGLLHRARSIHLDASQLRQLQHRGADAAGGTMD